MNTMDAYNIEYIKKLVVRQNVLRAQAACLDRVRNARPGAEAESWQGAATIFRHIVRLSEADRSTLLTSEWKNLHPGVRDLLNPTGEQAALNQERGALDRAAGDACIAQDSAGRTVRLDHPLNAVVDDRGDVLLRLDNRQAWDVRLSERVGRMTRRLLLGDLTIQDVWPGGTVGTQVAPHVEMASAIAAPATLVDHTHGSWFGQNANDAITQVLAEAAAPGGATPEVHPGLAATAFVTAEHFLSTFISGELRGNADFDLDAVALQRLVEAMMLARELRVAALLRNQASWTAANVVTVATGAKWNGGASADPIADLFAVVAASKLRPTHMIVSDAVARWFLTSTHVRDFVQAGGHVPGCIVAPAKTLVAGVPSYVWGNDVVLVRCPQSDTDLATARTLVWSGNMTNAEGVGRLFGQGLFVRTGTINDRGPRGGQLLVTGSNEVSVMLAGDVGGLILNAVQ